MADNKVSDKEQGYDLGGAECPIVTEDGVEWTVMDIRDPDWEVYDLPPGKFIRQDLREDFSHHPPVSNIWIGGMLRYLSIEEGYLSGRPLGYEQQMQFAERLDKILKPGGRVAIRDHLEVCTYILSDLICRDYSMEALKLSYAHDGDDHPSDWIITLHKPLEGGGD